MFFSPAVRLEPRGRGGEPPGERFYPMKALAQTFSIFPRTAVDQGCGLRAADVDLTGARDNLEVNLVIFSPEGQLPVVFVSIDALYPGRQLIEAVERGASTLPRDRILTGATHTHAAPMTDDTKPQLGAPAPGHLDPVARRLEQAVREMLASVDSASSVLVHGTADLADHSVNRRRRQRYFLSRRPRLAHVAMAPNPTGDRDETITLFSVSDASGTVIAVVWNYACHPVAQPSPEKYSSHFPGQVREAVRRRFANPGLPVLYFQGFSGDVRPSASVRPSTLIERARNAGRRTTFDQMSADAYDEWCVSLGSRVVEMLGTTCPLAVDRITTSVAQVAGECFTKEQPGSVQFQALALGPGITILAIGAEPVSSYAHWVRSITTTDLVMCVGCAGHTYGYLPTETIRQEGGYEGREFCAPFGLGEVSATIDTTARSAIRRVLDELDMGRREGSTT